MPRRLLLPLLAALFVAPALRAADDHDALRDRYRVLRDSLQATAGMRDADRAVVAAFREQTRAAADAAPSDAGLVALDLQVLLWLDRDPDATEDAEEAARRRETREAIAARSEQLAALRPDDAALALATLARRHAAGMIDDAGLREAEGQLARRFPGNITVVARWGARLRDEGRIEELRALVDDRDDLLEQPALAKLAGQVRVAEHRFEEAKDLLDAIEILPRTTDEVRLRREIQQLRDAAAACVDLWVRERELRAAEAEADDLPRAEIRTPRGRIVVELFENEAPNTVANFIALARAGFYDGTAFHRFEPFSVVQGGDVNSRPEVEGEPGTGNPGYTIPDEHGLDARRDHFSDSLGMARTRRADSGGSQFYFSLRPNVDFNGEYTVFGRVIEGLDVVRALRANDLIESVVVLRTRDHGYEPITIPLLEEEPATADDEETDGAAIEGSEGG